MAQDSPCGNWEPYKDEKCFKIIDETLRTYDEAIKTCKQQENSSSYVRIRSLEEQEFFSNFLFKTHKVVDAVWIGATYSSNKFKWADDSDVSFTNWVHGSPSNTTNKACVQMIPEGSSMGKWADEPCNKKNLVVCQKMQTWSLSRLQQTLLDARMFLIDSLNQEKNDRINSFNDVKNKLEDTKKQLDNLQQNPVPINFIYIQLPSQTEPKTLWSMVEWKDVTSDYAGLFFRAEGGGSEAFQQIQSENSPRLTAVNSMYKQGDGVYNDKTVLNPGETSRMILTGGSGDNGLTLSFEVSAGEVRPRNMAMRIWKRMN